MKIRLYILLRKLSYIITSILDFFMYNEEEFKQFLSSLPEHNLEPFVGQAFSNQKSRQQE